VPTAAIMTPIEALELLRSGRTGVEEFNRRRQANTHHLELTNANLGDLDLDEADLRGVDLSDAVLSGSSLRGADLRGCHLSAANLRGARLDAAKLNDCVLHEADLREASLVQADVSQAQLVGAQLAGASLVKAAADHANFSEATLTSADLSSCSAKRSKFERARLVNATLAAMIAPETNFTDAKLNEANCQGTDFNGAVLTQADLTAAQLQRSDLSRANMDDADLRGSDLDLATLKGARLRNADLRDVRNLRLDGQFIRLARFDPNSPDPWSVLRRTYTGPRMFLNLLLLVAFLAPYCARTLGWWSVHLAQEHLAIPSTYVTRSNATPVGPITGSWDPTSGPLDELADDLPMLYEIQRDEGVDRRLWQLLIRWDDGFWYAASSFLLISYNLLRLLLTGHLSLLRDAEERSGYAPKWDIYKRPEGELETGFSPRGMLSQLNRRRLALAISYGWAWHVHRRFLIVMYGVALASFVVHAFVWLFLTNVTIPASVVGS
jgi:uncharacterized protein YjbI with pentapeptide repeats